MKTIVLHVRALELNDVLYFNRLKAGIRKIVQSNRLVVVHSGQASGQSGMESSLQVAALKTFNKTFAAKLSEELLPAVALAAHHLGLAAYSDQSDEPNLSIRPKALLYLLQQGSIPIIAPIVKDTFHEEKIVESKELAEKVSATIQADLLIFLIEQKEQLQSKQECQAMLEGKYEARSQQTRGGRAVLTDISGMEQLVFAS